MYLLIDRNLNVSPIHEALDHATVGSVYRNDKIALIIRENTFEVLKMVDIKKHGDGIHTRYTWNWDIIDV